MCRRRTDLVGALTDTVPIRQRFFRRPDEVRGTRRRRIGSFVMMWLIVIVQLARAAPRQRRRVSGELAAAGAVGISEGVWAVPDTRFHRTVVAACMRRATNAG